MRDAKYRRQGVELKEAVVWEGADRDNGFEHGEKKTLCRRCGLFRESNHGV